MARWTIPELHVGRGRTTADEGDDRGEGYAEDASSALSTYGFVRVINF